MADDLKSWTELQGASAANTLSFTPAAAKIGLDACTDLMYSLLAVKKGLDSPAPNTAGDPVDFAGPNNPFRSGHDWAQAFKIRATEVAGILNMHVGIVNAMADTFKSAITQFDAAEQESVAALKNVKMPTEAKESAPQRSGSTIASRVPTVEPYQETVDYSQVKNYQPPNSQYSVMPESAFDNSLSWENFRALKLSIDQGRVISLAADWEKMRNDLSAAHTAFMAKRNAIWLGWQGTSRKMGQDAVDAYGVDLQTLASKLENVEKGILAAAAQLKGIQDKLPDKDIMSHISKNGSEYTGKYPDSRSVVDSDLENVKEGLTNIVRRMFQYYYVAGIMRYNHSIDSMALPLPASKAGTPVAPVAPVEKQPADNPAGSPAGSPNTSPSSPSSPSNPTTTDETEAAKKAAEEAAKKSAEEAAKLAAETTKQAEETTKQQALESLSTAVSEALTSLQTIASEGLTSLQSLASEGMTALQSAVEQSVAAVEKLSESLTSVENIDQPVDSIVPTGGPTTTDPGKTTTGGGGSPGGSPATTTVPKETTTTKVTPRAAIATEATAALDTTSRAGLATTSGTTSGTPMGGMPMSGAGAGAQGQGKEHKRPEFLRSSENLDEVFEETPVAVRAVAEK